MKKRLIEQGEHGPLAYEAPALELQEISVESGFLGSLPGDYETEDNEDWDEKDLW